jgi:uncharacterized protein YehS (DUF1456 family)
MENNDILRRLRYTFDFGDDKMIALFGLGKCVVTRTQISDWLKKDDAPDYKKLDDNFMAMFLNGFIIDKRGRKDGVPHIVESRLNNNIVFRKLKIALDLKGEDVLAILELADVRISKHELSAFFRNPNQVQYRSCQDQILRNFLQGMQTKYHGNKKEMA